MDKKQKIILIIAIAVVAIVIIIGIGLAIFSKNADVELEEGNAQTVQSKYSWPDLKEYNIPNLEVGTITDLKDECNKNNYELNYSIKVSSIKKSDLEEYSKKFESTWNVSQTDDSFIILTSDRVRKYSVYITFDEANDTAEFTITSL